jgi:hypothetical protein
VVDKGEQYLLLADEDLMSLTSNGGTFATLYDRNGRATYSLA